MKMAFELLHLKVYTFNLRNMPRNNANCRDHKLQTRTNTTLQRRYNTGAGSHKIKPLYFSAWAKLNPVALRKPKLNIVLVVLCAAGLR